MNIAGGMTRGAFGAPTTSSSNLMEGRRGTRVSIAPGPMLAGGARPPPLSASRMTEVLREGGTRRGAFLATPPAPRAPGAGRWPPAP
eukprot:CAMPEP_0182886424 /NCGR_PEP_ID=MMETSP0034_2-20130328/20208_1 /TAXON_ID=156128 /ORGANISM="Nephroselmis pyriformis, Strain CCMP717" /LENGTH=86 /DNA_ID=CAMNT_0025019747 /DNA_START=72 /DNA_END=332 /DNA_ORIENTATION=+